jgi:hypothetical protein
MFAAETGARILLLGQFEELEVVGELLGFGVHYGVKGTLEAGAWALEEGCETDGANGVAAAGKELGEDSLGVEGQATLVAAHNTFYI